MMTIIDPSVPAGQPGHVVLADTQINQDPGHTWSGPPQFAELANGNFVAVWHDGAGTTDNHIYYRLYDQNGAALGDEVKITTTNGTLMDANSSAQWDSIDVVATGPNTFSIGWMGNDANSLDGDGTSVLVSNVVIPLSTLGLDPITFIQDSVVIGGETDEATGDTLDLSLLSDAVDIAYTGDESGTIEDGVGTLRFEEIENLVTTEFDDVVDASVATSGVDVDTGAGDDSILGGAGDDTLTAGTGADTVDGGAGDDVIALEDDGDPDVVVLADGDGDDTITGFDAPVDNGDGTFTPVDTLDVSGLTDADGNPVDTTDVVVTDTNGDGTGDPVLTFPNGESVTLTGVDPTPFLDPSTQDDALTALGIPEGPDGIVEGSSGDDLIDVDYTGDPGGDMVDANDATNGVGVPGSDDDSIDAGDGNDKVLAGDGDDTISGGLGEDSLDGGAGDDVLDGGDDADTISAGTGDDSILGGAGDDSIYGSEGSDTVDGGDGDDYINTRTSPGLGVPDTGLIHPTDPTFSYPADTDPNNDRDLVYGGAGNDTILSGDDDDTVYGGLGNDVIDAGFDADLVYGEAGADSIQGSEGADTIDGGDGNDVIYGGISPLDPNFATAQEFDLTDDIDPDPLNNADSLLGGAGDDSIFGQDDADTLDGGEGNDYLDGGIDDDSILGGAGDDTLAGGSGSDTLAGGEGTDVLDGDAGDDAIAVGGTDTANGGSGDDAFTLDATDPASDIDVTIDGGSDGTDGNPDDATNGDAGDLLDLGDQTADLTVTLTSDPETGTVDGLDADGTPDIAFTDIEILETGAGDDTVDGSAATSPVDVDTGAGDDSILGGAGDDTLTAGTGADTVDGGAGDDVIALEDDGDPDVVVLADGDGDDTITGFDAPVDNGAGTFTPVDTLDVSGLTDADGNPVDTTDVVVTDTNGDGTGDPVLTFPNGESVTLTGVDPTPFLDPSTQDDALTALGIPEGPDGIVEGSSGDDLIDVDYTGDPGGDMVDANDATNGVGVPGSDDDSIDAGDGNDIVLAGDGDDTISGGLGEDSLDGGAGDDVLDGGDGQDVLGGGLGNDTFVAGAGHDTITDFGDDLGDPDDGDAGNNDVIDLSDFYNQANYDAAVAQGDIDPAVISNPLEWLKADMGDDGVLNDTAAGWSATDTLTLQNGGAPVDASALTQETTNVICFTSGTLIKTINGEIPVEELSVGTRVLTMDASFEQVRWIGSRHLTQAELAENPHLRPIRISAGSLGANMPEHDLVVSPQHRILINSIVAERMFGEREVLVPAKQLLDHPGVEVDQTATEVTYWHFLFENHQIVFSNGMPAESLFTGPEALRAVGPAAREEIFALFPEIAEVNHDALPRSARRIVKGRAVRKLVARVVQNRKDIFENAC